MNHIEDWNPNDDVRRTTLEAGTVPAGDDEATARIVLDRLKINDKPRAAIWISPAQLRIVLENRTLTLDAPTGHVEDERVSRPPLCCCSPCPASSSRSCSFGGKPERRFGTEQNIGIPVFLLREEPFGRSEGLFAPKTGS